MRVALRCLLLTLPLLLAGCAEIGSRPDASVAGTVTLVEATALPPDALLRVTLLDLDEGAAPVAEVEIEAPDVPAAFELRYDPRAIHPAHRYVVQAQISAAGRLLFLTTDEHRVVTGGAGDRVRMVLRRPGAG